MFKELSVESIEKAKSNFSKIIKKTPLDHNTRLSKKYKCKVYLKREDRQLVRSYKIRGAYNAICCLTTKERKKGVVCASAGNHAQGVALTCRHFKIKGTIFMPRTTPMQKVTRTKKFGKNFIEIRLVGDTFDEAYNESIKFSKKQNSNFIHPFDDIKTIIGQGTIASEILDELEEPIDYLIVPIGGGGLISGLSVYFKTISPNTKIIGVEPNGSAGMYESIKASKVIELPEIDTFVDGVAVKKVGGKTFKIVEKNVDKIIKIPENRICTSMLDFLQEEGIILEPAGTLSVDVLKDLKEEIEGKTVVSIVSGGNFDFERLPIIKERSLKYEGLKKYYVIEFAQRPGALGDFLKLLGPDDDIVRFEYLKKTIKEKGPALVGIETKNPKNFERLKKRFENNNIKYKDLTDNELFFDLLV